MIQTICKEGAKGIDFNKLIERARTFASRSTVAVRIERLVRLGYLEKSGGSKRTWEGEASQIDLQMLLVHAKRR